jgi:ammonia channel protein AmtB
MSSQMLIQIAGVIATMVWSGLVTYPIVLGLKLIIVISPNADDIEEGLNWPPFRPDT